MHFFRRDTFGTPEYDKTKDPPDTRDGLITEPLHPPFKSPLSEEGLYTALAATAGITSDTDPSYKHPMGTANDSNPDGNHKYFKLEP